VGLKTSILPTPVCQAIVAFSSSMVAFSSSMMAISSIAWWLFHQVHHPMYINVYNWVLWPNFHTTVHGQHGFMTKEIIPEPKIQWCLVEHWINSTFPLLLFNIAFGMWMSKLYQPFLRLSSLDLTELGRSICGNSFISGSDDINVTFGLKPHNGFWSYLTICGYLKDWMVVFSMWEVLEFGYKAVVWMNDFSTFIH
jgi:hypothetical protein